MRWFEKRPITRSWKIYIYIYWKGCSCHLGFEIQRVRVPSDIRTSIKYWRNNEKYDDEDWKAHFKQRSPPSRYTRNNLPNCGTSYWRLPLGCLVIVDWLFVAATVFLEFRVVSRRLLSSVTLEEEEDIPVAVVSSICLGWAAWARFTPLLGPWT